MESVEEFENDIVNLYMNIYKYDNYDDNIVDYSEEVKDMFYEDGVKLSSPIPIQ